MWQTKKRNYPWLVSNNEKMGFSVCNEVSNFGCCRGKSIHISKEWSVMATEVHVVTGCLASSLSHKNSLIHITTFFNEK